MNYGSSLPSLESADVANKRVFVRCDLDARLSERLTIEDDSRLVRSIGTIEYLLEKGASVIVAGHLRRPEGWDEKYSLKIVADWFAEQFGSTARERKFGDFKGFEIKENFQILENLRFFEGEKSNNPEFVKKLASLADVYVNEAFGTSHRAQASIVGLPSFLPHFAGFHFIKEVTILSKVLGNPIRPLTMIIGGAKMETKLPLVSKMAAVADHILIGGKISDEDKISIEGSLGKAKIEIAVLKPEGTDISDESLEKFIEIIGPSGMIVWNGPLGKLEDGHEDSSLQLAKAISESMSYKIAGGGDTVAFLNKQNLFDKFDFVSMGGGAMLQFLSGEDLPGITALQT